MRRLARCPVRRLSAAGLHWAWQEHEVWQRTKPASVRVVLLIRFWHPDIAPARYPEAYHHMKKSYLQHKRRILVPPLKRPTKDERRAASVSWSSRPAWFERGGAVTVRARTGDETESAKACSMQESK